MLGMSELAARRAAQRPGQRGDGDERQQPPGIDPSHAREESGDGQRSDHEGSNLPVIADHEVVAERGERFQRPDNDPALPSVADITGVDWGRPGAPAPRAVRRSKAT
jgi:hypothetical protein